MNMEEKIISENILENVCGGAPIYSSEDRKRFKEKKDGIHTTFATFTPACDHTVFTSTVQDGLHTTSASFGTGTEFTSTYENGLHTTFASFE